jgi:hypothetical protein
MRPVLRDVRSAFVIGFLVCLLAALPAVAAPPVPERLTYDLSWLGIPIGSASQEISDEKGVRRIVSHASSNAWLSSFYPVDDRTETLLSPVGPFPGTVRSYRMVFREGGWQRDREIVFDAERRIARFHDRVSGERTEIPYEPPLFDVYGSFYHVRSLPLEVGKSCRLSILDGRQVRRIEVRVLRRERVTVPAGTFDTIVVQPVVAQEGIFERKRGITIWLTDDDRRVPVKARTKVKVGSVTAELTGGIR